MSARAAVNKYNPISYFCISAALLKARLYDTTQLDVELSCVAINGP